MRRNIHFEKILDVDEKKALDVVLNFKDYSDFIPGCSGSELLKRDFPKEIGKLEFNILGKEYFIVSENTISDNSIKINQTEGPFEFFEGTWIVEAINEKSCNIKFAADFKLPFLLNAITSQAFIDKLSSTIIESFIKRAV
jgi:ribosome-associated toxin RatA of RatAB toxin-antitoxin module